MKTHTRCTSIIDSTMLAEHSIRKLLEENWTRILLAASNAMNRLVGHDSQVYGPYDIIIITVSNWYDWN